MTERKGLITMRCTAHGYVPHYTINYYYWVRDSRYTGDHSKAKGWSKQARFAAGFKKKYSVRWVCKLCDREYQQKRAVAKAAHEARWRKANPKKVAAKAKRYWMKKRKERAAYSRARVKRLRATDPVFEAKFQAKLAVFKRKMYERGMRASAA